MHLLVSFLYAPLMIIFLKYYPIWSVAIGIILFAVGWLFTLRSFDIKRILFPLFYLLIGVATLLMQNAMILKVLPLTLACAFCILLMVSYLEKDSLILHFAKKFHKKEISAHEEAYIHRSSQFWITLSLMNIIIHVLVILSDNTTYWVLYTSFGWYFLFAFGGLCQFLHRHFIFLKQGL